MSRSASVTLPSSVVTLISAWRANIGRPIEASNSHPSDGVLGATRNANAFLSSSKQRLASVALPISTKNRVSLYFNQALSQGSSTRLANSRSSSNAWESFLAWSLRNISSNACSSFSFIVIYHRGRVADPFALFLLTNPHRCMIPLQYVNAEELVWLFRVADPFGFKGSGF